MAYSTYRMPFRYHLTPWVKRLLIINGAVFVLGMIVGPELLWNWFGFSSRDIIAKPWAIGTYMFVHGGFWHLFWNMVGLFFFGPPLEEKWGSQEFLRYYLVCGIGGVVLGFFFPSALVVGASAAIYGVMLAFAMNWPNAPIYVWGILPVKAKWLVGAFAVLAFSNAVFSPGGAGGGVAHFAHAGGLIAGFLYLRSDFRGSRSKRPSGTGRPRRLAIVPRDTAAVGESHAKAQARREERDDRELLDAVDRVLDKISAQGIESLTEEERKLLDEVSRRHRTN